MDDVEAERRALELLREREARRSRVRRAWRDWWPGVVVLLLLAGIGGAYWWDHVQDQREADERRCEIYSTVWGTDPGSC